MKRQTLVLALSLCAMSAALATTYVRTEKDGTKTYSDRPIPGDTPIDVQPAQTYSAPPSGVTQVGSAAQSEQDLLRQADDFRYESCTVTPDNDTTFQNPEAVAITVYTKPPLRNGDVITMTIDGQPAGPPNTMNYTMQPAYRGTHTVGVNVANTNGKNLCTYTSVFHVHQPGLNSPARQSNAPARPPRPNVPRPTPH